MIWQLAHRFEQPSRRIADRHYNRRAVGSPQFVPPGRCLVLRTKAADALWVTSWPFAEYTKHAWAGAWVCSCFRREGGEMRASEMIGQAVAATRARWPEVPALGMITFINRERVRPIKVRGVETWGRTWRLAGFEDAGETKGGLLALRLPPERMPEPVQAIGTQGLLL